MVLHPFRLRFKRIGVKSRGVVFDVQTVQTFAVVQHEAGAKPAAPPLLEIAVDAAGVFGKFRAPPVKLPVVAQIMHAHFKSVGAPVPRAIPGGFGSRPSGMKLKDERKPIRFSISINWRHLASPPECLHVMRQHEGKLFPLRPTRPARRRLACIEVDRPDILALPALHFGQGPPRRHSQMPRAGRV